MDHVLPTIVLRQKCALASRDGLGLSVVANHHLHSPTGSCLSVGEGVLSNMALASKVLIRYRSANVAEL